MQHGTMRWPASIGLACAIAVALTAPGATRADEVRWAATATAPVPSPTFARPVANSQLADLRGGTQNTHNDMTLSGTTADNSAYQVTTGSNAISTGSFANMSGIPVVIQNTGANVLIQNAVILNLQMN